ncbi:thioredoxin domain-containing protein [Desulfatibacillum aliphaticivorans]|uniref:thioredoxin domain-containing protein n=1 Tax=Desulfatibacillum aliphaticivorans TaxID=218208 RepID=UPI00041552FE|nr:thioredoxin domain-containing protein [Desulfatibacillum aliphaticivorans]
MDSQARRTHAYFPTPEEIRTLPPDGGANYNRLIFEKSPYLLQHAANPVDWRPWGDEAFEQAKKEDKPVFLSIGYSTCHWCHVMERESFEDPEAAALLNRHFICIKVDREERPDIDHVYMSVTQAMTGAGGWPMSVFLTPGKEPFYAGTYFPKEDHMGRPGLMRLATLLGELWKNERSKALNAAQQVVQALSQAQPKKGREELGPHTLGKAFAGLKASYDVQRGGFGRGNKFPTPHNLTFLLRYWKRTGDAEALAMVEKTLTAMRMGGIYDHVGFGIHRYATDPNWLLPHFEKMLYDQALTANALLEAYQATGKEEYATNAREIFTYVLRDMTSPEGGFYSAEDADSEGEEGKFYVWTTKEITEILGKEDGALFISAFNLVKGGNFFDQATGQKTGDSIPHLQKDPGRLAADLGMEKAELESRLEKIRAALFAEREKRIHPYKDDKILTDWNGLMIAALAKGGRVLGDEKYTLAAVRAANFILDALQDGEGHLQKRFREGEAALPGLLDDYAFMVWGLLELYESTFGVKWLKKAVTLNETMLDLFWDRENGGLFMSPVYGEKLFMRGKDLHDGAQPSGNSVAAVNLLRLAGITANEECREKAEAILQAFSGQIEAQPYVYTHLLGALDFIIGPALEIVICGDQGARDSTVMLDGVNQRFVPNKVLVFRPNTEDCKELDELAPYTREQACVQGKATAYVCQGYTCQRPTTDPEALFRILS